LKGAAFPKSRVSRKGIVTELIDKAEDGVKEISLMVDVGV
jgi:hypothetical protein